jgi:glycerol kinase
MDVVLSIDQGTTGTTTLLVDKKGKIIKSAYKEIPQFYPKPGWVEHDPEAIWESVVSTIDELLNFKKYKVISVGITNQRETVVVWNRQTGKSLCPAIVWQCCRTEEYCKNLKNEEVWIKESTGLPLDSYFSASKFNWILENYPEARSDEWLVGTIDSWLIWNLTGNHFTDPTNASRTQLFNINTMKWDSKLCQVFGVPQEKLPVIKSSQDNFGEIKKLKKLKGVSVLGVAGDQQSALFGQGCVNEGQIKNTYGTGAFLLLNTGQKRICSNSGLLTTIAINAEGESCYALEGSVFICGAAIQWLRDGL